MTPGGADKLILRGFRVIRESAMTGKKLILVLI